MARKRIPLLIDRDTSYSASLAQREIPDAPQGRDDPGEKLTRSELPADLSAQASTPLGSGKAIIGEGDPSAKIDVRVTALVRQEGNLRACGIAPAQVIRAAMRRAVKTWTLSANYVRPPDERRAKDPDWTVRTSVAVPAATFDRLQAEQDPLGVCSRWSLVRGQFEPQVWREIDLLLASLSQDADDD